MRRRDFLSLPAAALAYPPSTAIKGVRALTKPARDDATRGDVWEATWADDGNLYAAADDTRGVNRSCNSNLAIFRLDGTPPDHRVVTVNCMPEYGRLGQKDGLDTWKANGLVSVDGVLYLAVSQHSGAGDYPDNVQRVFDASIVKSADHGKTWSARPQVGRPMFGTSRFVTPFFVQFGKDYQGATDEYVYAVSNSGTWNNGNYMILGRVARDRIGRLAAADWEFFAAAEGAEKPAWTGRVRDARAVFRDRGFTSMTGMHYLPAFRRFLLMQWAYTNLDAPDAWQHTALSLYEAPQPWGPWSLVHRDADWGNGAGYYNPGLPAKWFEDGGRRAWMTMAGDFTKGEAPGSPYCFTVQKLEFIT